MGQGIAFNESSEILFKTDSEYKSFPAITLKAFSIECSLKALLLITCGKYPNEHNSEILFKGLPETLRLVLSQQFFNSYKLDMATALAHTKKDFMDSRYHFSNFKTSNTSKHFYVGYLEVLAEFFIEYIKANGEEIYSTFSAGNGV